MRGRLHRRVFLSLHAALRRISVLIVQPVFIGLALLGNGCVLAGALGLYYLEHDVNSKLQTWLDALWWAVATVTTVGYGDVHPVTLGGKIIGMGMMIVGTALFMSYTALFAGAVLSAEIREVESEMKSLEKILARLSSMSSLDIQSREKLIEQLEGSLKTLKKEK